MVASVAVMAGLVLLVNASRYGSAGVLVGFLLVGAGAAAGVWGFRGAGRRFPGHLPTLLQPETQADDEMP